MNEFWKRTRELIGRYWGALGVGSRVGLVVCLLIIGGTLVSVVGWFTAENLVVLAGPDRTAEERSQIKTVLDDRKIPYKIRGDSILMTPENRDKASLDLAGEGIYSERQIFSWLDEVRLTATRWSSMRQWQVALGRRLAQILRRSDVFQDVDVHIGAETEGRRLGEPETEAGAVVRVRMRGGQRLTNKHVRSIATFVAGAVPEIKPQNVTVFDAATGEGHQMPPDDDAARTSARMSELEDERAEKLRRDIEEGLRTIFPKATALVGVKLSRNETDRLDVQRPESGLIVASERDELRDSTTIQQPEVGMAGQGPAPLPRTQRDTNRTQENESRTVEAGFTRTQTRTPAGEPETIGVSVIIPEALEAARSRLGMPDPVKDVEDIVKNYVPIGQAQREQRLLVTVKFLPPPPPAAFPPVPLGEKIQEWFVRLYRPVGLTALALVALFIVVRMLRKAIQVRAPAGIEELAKAVEEVPEEVLRARELDAVGGRMRAAVREIVSKNPRAVATVLKRWLAMR